MWNEHRIAAAVCRQTFNRKCLLLVDRCQWTGHECDVLGVTMDLRLIDVEIKISRADLKADAAKDKWWASYGWNAELGRVARIHPRERRDWPPKVWKHYYALPADIWVDALLESLPSERSGVLLVSERKGMRGLLVQCVRRATPNKDAERLTPAQAIDIARLANLRMWDAYERVERIKADRARAGAALDPASIAEATA
jgi:hypothetical protein